MKVKICGVCSPADAALVATAGADYIGVILARRGPRQQTIAQAQAIYREAGSLSRVGVFADQTAKEVLAAAEALALDVVQLHGTETVEAVETLHQRFKGGVWKMIAPSSQQDVADAIAQYGDLVSGMLFDSPGGGRGVTFDWSIARTARPWLRAEVQCIVAGGLNPDNVQAVIQQLRPDIVDVSSGVESTIGKKSREQVVAFVRNART